MLDQDDLQGGDNPIEIDCMTGPPSGPLTDCEKEEICVKCANINQQAKQGKLKTPSDARYEENRRLGDNKCKSLKRAAKKGGGCAEELGFTAHSDKCKKELRDKAENSDPPYDDFSPDHVQEVQLCGHPTDHANLRWMSSNTNEWVGRKMQDFKTSGPDKNTGIKPNCC